MSSRSTISSHQIFRQSFKILNSNLFHFITISFLFIPLTISLSYHTAVPQNLLTLKTLAVSVTLILSTVAGTALIAYSTHQSIHRKPLTFVSAFKSLSDSFIPLIYTLIVYILISSIISSSINATTTALSMQVISFELLFIIWGYAAAISVLESKSGIMPLLQSIKQSVQFRYVSFSIVGFTGFVILTNVFTRPGIYDKGMTAMFISVLFHGSSYMLVSFTILFYVVANTLLYVRCKVACGEEIIYRPVERNVPASDGFNFMIQFFFVVRMIALCILKYLELI